MYNCLLHGSKLPFISGQPAHINFERVNILSKWYLYIFMYILIPLYKWILSVINYLLVLTSYVYILIRGSQPYHGNHKLALHLNSTTSRRLNLTGCPILYQVTVLWSQWRHHKVPPWKVFFFSLLTGSEFKWILVLLLTHTESLKYFPSR